MVQGYGQGRDQGATSRFREDVGPKSPYGGPYARRAPASTTTASLLLLRGGRPRQAGKLPRRRRLRIQKRRASHFDRRRANARAGHLLVTLTDDPSAPEIFFVDPSTLTGEDAAGDYDPLTRRIRLTDYAKSPYIYATIDLSDQAAERLSLHELGHAMGIGHVEKIQANFDDDMWPSDGNYVAPVSDAVWSQYREQLNDAGVKCPTVPRSSPFALALVASPATDVDYQYLVVEPQDGFRRRYRLAASLSSSSS